VVPAAAPEQDESVSLPIHLTDEERQRLHEIGINHRSTAPPIGSPRNAAEWEPSEGVIIRWPLGISVAIVAEMSEGVMVTTIVGSSSQQQSATNAYSSGGVNMANTQFIIAPTDTYWTRDYGPWFIFEDTSMAIVDHIYNRPRPYDDLIPQVIGAAWGLDVYGMDLIHTGGNHMSDGLGMSASTELVYHENPSKTQTEIHDLMRDYLGNEYTVLEYIESGGIHHIDCWAKYLNPTTILVKDVAAGHPSHNLLNARADWLAQQISPWGEPYSVVRVYCPSGTAYTNSLILNDKVLVPIFNSSWDNVALQVYQDAMPGYEILGFTGSWLDNDAIHCRAMGVPDRHMLFIDHVPFKTADITTGDYAIEAEIVANSLTPLVPDQLRVYYSADGGLWDYVPMTATGVPDTYAGDVPAQDEDSLVRYYIEAGDESGRLEHHPYIGRPDPHEFVAVCPNHPLVDVTPNGPLAVCSGSSQRLTTRLTGGLGPFGYQWSQDGIDLPGETGPDLVIGETGSHAYNCEVWGAGCTNSRTDPEPVEISWQLEPVFEGIASVSSPMEETCTLDLAWAGAVPACDGPPYYDVYRSTLPDFVPDEATRLVSGVGATGYRDTHALITGQTYYYIVRARDDSNGAADDNLVVRQGVPVGPLMESDWHDDAEAAPRFTAAGLWHLADDTTCRVPGTRRPTHSYYFADEARCDYGTGSTVSGTLTSETIAGVAASSELSFHSYLHTEQTPGRDRAFVEISTDGGRSWAVLDSDVSNGGTLPDGGGAWSFRSYGLADYEGRPVLIRFRFESVDEVSNDNTGWLLDEIVISDAFVTRGCTTGTGCRMTVNVTPNGTTAVCAGTDIQLTATPDGGTAPYSYQWTEDGVPIPGATQSSLTVSHAMVGAHSYNCIVADSDVCADVVDGYDVIGEWVPCGSVVTVADGSEGGTVPLTVAKSGSDLTVFWDAATPGCTSEGYHLIWGWGSDLSTYGVAGSDCTLDETGTHLWTTSPVTLWNWAWFLVVGNDGYGTEGGWGTDSFGNERSVTASGECGMTTLDASACLP
jgi:agmatine/peptidylarginine deiminase